MSRVTGCDVQIPLFVLEGSSQVKLDDLHGTYNFIYRTEISEIFYNSIIEVDNIIS